VGELGELKENQRGLAAFAHTGKYVDFEGWLVQFMREVPRL
jgi:hypothetical protein